MARSLKERYEHKRLHDLSKRVKQTDARVITEVRAAQLIVEAMDEDDLDKVSSIIEKLASIKTPELPKLTAAIEQAEAEINKHTAGGPLTKAWTKLKGVVGIDNPIVKVSAFTDALERGFSLIPQILKNNGIDLKNVDLNKSLVQVIGGEPSGRNQEQQPNKNDKKPAAEKPEQFSDDDDYSTPKMRIGGDRYRVSQEGVRRAGTLQAEAGPGGQAEAKLKSVAAQLQKALSPGGIFGAFKKVPYIDSATLAQELLRAPLGVFSRVVKRINSGVRIADVAQDLKAATAAGDTETRGTGHGEPTKPTSQTTPSSPSKDTVGTTGTTPTGESPPRQQKPTDDDYAKALQKLTGLMSNLRGQDGLEKLAKKLVNAGLDPSRL